MLPGFRFLFAAVMLSMSLLVFGLGAAALLRAAHESFASNSSWRGSPEVTFAQRPETTLPMLATLRVEPVTEKASDEARVAAAPVDPAPTIAEPVASEQVAAVKPADTPRLDAVKPDSAPVDKPAAQILPAPETAPAAAADVPDVVAIAPVETKIVETKTAESKTAAVMASDASPDDSAQAMAEPEPEPAALPQPTTPQQPTVLQQPAPETVAAVTPATGPGASPAATKIATLGGPPVDIVSDKPGKEKNAATSEQAKDDQSAIKKRARARRARLRRLAARARLVAQQQQLQANPFAQQQTFPPAPIPPRQ